MSLELGGGVLSGPEISRIVHHTRNWLSRGDGIESVPRPAILIEPFDDGLVGPNSYDVHLSDQIRMYALSGVRRVHPELFRDKKGVLGDGIDPRKPPPTVEATIPDDGMWLYPGVLYLGSTVERTQCCGLVPWLDGRSSTGRMGLSMHVTAGRGDDGWLGTWTCEITAVTHPVKVYPRMRLAQLTYFTLVGNRKPYSSRLGSRYNDQCGPTESRFNQGESL